MGKSLTEALPLAATAEPSSPSAVVPALLAISATALSLAAWDANGTFTQSAICWLATCVAAALVALVSLASRSSVRIAGLVSVVILACICAQFAAVMWSPIDYPTDKLGTGGMRFAVFLIATAAVVSGSLCSSRPAFGKWTFPVLLLIQAVLGAHLVSGLMVPGIDVLMFQRKSCAALLQGSNPYALTFPDPYPPASSAVFYGPGVSVNGILQFGYPYMPITLFMALPGYVVGDVRYAGLACVVIATALIGYSRRTPETRMATALLMFSPIASLVSVLAWTESYVLLLLAITWFCYCRKPKLAPYAFGLLIVSKQYMLGMAPLGLLLLPRPWTLRAIAGFAAKAASAGLVITMPLVLWNPKAFWDSAITLQARQPYRPDALSFLIWAAPANPAKWVWLPFAGFATMLLVCLGTAMRRRITFPMALALCLLAFFALNKQAFANYYYLVIASLCVGVAGDAASEERAGNP